jgi:hypothetical protein
VHDAPAWVTVTVFPATVMVPVRDVTAVLADTENCVRPLPATLLPPVIAIQAALLIAVQGQPLGVLTVIVKVPAP